LIHSRRTRQALAALAIASSLGACATGSTYLLKSTIREKPGVIGVTMLGGLIATSVVSWKVLDTDSGSYRPTIFVPLIAVIDLLGAVSVAMTIH